MSECEILIDTNQVLHFKPIDQIDWCKLTGAEHCKLVIAPILLRELEQKKIFSPSAALKARASRMIDFLVGKMAQPDPIALRDNVTLVFVEKEPSIDFPTNGLVREVNDDHYIATALEQLADGSIKVLIASNDGGMALKLRSRPIDVLRLPDDMKLPEEVDAEQKKYREATRELAQLKAQRPKLIVTFADGSLRREIHNAREMDLSAPDSFQIRNDHPYLPVPRADSPYIGSVFSLLSQGGLSEIERYNSELPEFYEQYDRYLVDLRQWTEMLRLTATIQIMLENKGSATATNVDVTLRFPMSVLVMSPSDCEHGPEAPDPPRKPGELNIWGGGRTFGGYSSPAYDPDELAPWVDDDDRHTVHFSTKSLKQKCRLQLGAFLLTRAPALLGKGIEIDVTTTFHEGEPVKQKLAMTFVETDAQGSDD